MTDALTADWLGASRRAAEAVQGILTERPSTEERMRETGTQGDGGDATLVIDADAEAAVFCELDALHRDGARFTAVSEERGWVDFGSPDVRVVIDPIDGSKNAMRGLPQFAISIAVADGPTMADVAFAFVYDYGAKEEWTARRGKGAWLDGARLRTDVPERRTSDGRLEMLGIEAADPSWLREAADDLVACAFRLRTLGSMAAVLCQVAAARLDGMVALRRTRAVDIAAAQLIVREGGGQVAFPAYADPLGAPLDSHKNSPLVAARTPAGLRDLLRVPVD